LVIVKPETLIGWHRKGFQLFWKGNSQAGRPRLPENIRKLIVQMAQENPTWMSLISKAFAPDNIFGRDNLAATETSLMQTKYVKIGVYESGR
jgi:hypothetical protein